VRIVDIRERSIPVSRYDDPSIPSGGLDTSVVAIVTDAFVRGERVVGYGFSSIGRFAQSGLLRERFIPRLLDARGELDPFGAWDVMMQGEKPGGHGERCVAVGTLDMALWDAAAKIAEVPLYMYLAERAGTRHLVRDAVCVYAGGGYRYPADDTDRLKDELREFLRRGYTHAKIKIGRAPLEDDLRRIEAALSVVPAGCLAVDAMNAYAQPEALAAAHALRDYGLWWFEDVCDPLDFETQARVASEYGGAIAAGEALFSLAEARLLHRWGGLDARRDVLLFDPVHAYGIPEYLRIVEYMTRNGWPRSSFWPHGGHLFSLHVVAALGLGGAEMNPSSFAPFGGLSDGARAHGGAAALPQLPGIGFESKRALMDVFEALSG
jgi:L-alanine-DL-glutamate epimerase-like enolase superfamily enzyme